MPDNINQAIVGLNLDSTIHQLKEGALTYAMNAAVENFDGNILTYQNEQGNIHCISFPKDYKVIGIKAIPELNKGIYFLTNPITKDSEIGWSEIGKCEYTTLISDKGNSSKFNFSIEHPIHKVVTKTTNCITQLYWTDGYNPRRYIDLTELPWKEKRNPNNDFKPELDLDPVTGQKQLDANKLLVQPNFSIPIITPVSVNIGGELVMGVYQFAIQYSNSLGEGYTSYFSVTNPINIFENKTSPNFDLQTGKSITINVSNIDTTGIYDYFNIAVIKTVNLIPTVLQIGTFPVTATSFEYTYTGADKSAVQLTLVEVVEKFPHYDIANDIFEVDNSLGWADLKASDEINYQQIWSNVTTYWETYQLPYNQFQGYTNGVNSALYRGYMRDEVYSFEGYFLLRDGRQTKAFHIPGRVKNAFDKDGASGNDANSVKVNPCTTTTVKERWEVYNTAQLIGYTEEYEASKKDDCYIGPYQKGTMAYWESIDKYPNNPFIWGDLANKQIRHHKFPDNAVTHIHDNNSDNKPSFEHKIYPIGLKIDTGSIQDAITRSNLTQEQKDNIVGFGIARGNRAGGNSSVIAKGIFNNVGKYTFEEKDYYYANYPYNDLRPDPYFVGCVGEGDTKTCKLKDHVGYRPDRALNGFQQSSKSRFTFHSPDTHFTQPSLDSGQMLKVEGVVFGKSQGHFVKVDRNAEYKFLTKEAYMASAAVALSSGLTVGAGTFGTPTYSLEGAAGVYNSMVEIFEKLAPFTNFGYSFNSKGTYSNFQAIPNSGNKIREINTSKYIVDGYQGIEIGNTINNYRRESSIYIHTASDILFPHEYGGNIPVDISRYCINSFVGNVGINYLEQFHQEFVDTNSQIITDEFIDISRFNNTGTISSPAPIYIFSLTVGSPAGGGTCISPAGPAKDSTYYDTYGNKFVTRFKLSSMGGAGGTCSTTVYLALTAVGSQAPDLTAPYLYIEPTSPVSSIATFHYNGLDVTTVSEFYASPVGRTVYTDLIRGILESFVTNSALLESQTNTSTDEGFLLFLAIATYFDAYVQYLSSQPKDIPGKERETDISTYYGSIKRILPNQWGRMYSYETISTGYYQPLYDNNKNHITEYPTIFGGDTFINEFTYKSKVPLFLDNTVNSPDGADIAYDEIGTYGYPMFWISTKPIKVESDLKSQAEKTMQVVLHPDFWDVIAAIFTGGGTTINASMDLLIEVFTTVFKTLGVKNVNLDNYSSEDLTEQGIMYLFAYGLPTYFCESAINVESRQATNDTNGNFYPNIGNNIPDTWFQEVTTPIINDNTYTYNTSFSKQNNKENYFAHLREDFDPSKACLTYFQNRVIWSNKSHMEETKNNWLTYKPSNFFDLSKSWGKLTAVDAMENYSILVRFQNKSQIYNSMVIVDTSTFAAQLGSGKLFSDARPIDLSHTDVGSAGSQHKFSLKTDYGVVYVDAIRGQVLIVGGQQVEDLAEKGMDKFFSNNLPFKILEAIPNVPIDNGFKDIGIQGIYDTLYKRIIITKLDYEPLNPNITYEDGKFKLNGRIVSVKDKSLFKDHSWTLSYSFKTQSWVSFHSYKPNYYIAYPNHFQSGVNDDASLWSHNISTSSFNKFYGSTAPYILEYPFVYKKEDEIVQSIQDYCSARIYYSDTVFTEPDTILYFNKAIVYNEQQCSGTLTLVPKKTDDLSSRFAYPKYNLTNKEILLSKSDHFYQFNTFWDITKDTNTPNVLQCSTDNPCLNDANLDYAKKGYNTGAIRGKDSKVRLILDDKDNVKLISRFIITNTQTSYK